MDVGISYTTPTRTVPVTQYGGWCRVKTATISPIQCEGMREYGRCPKGDCIVPPLSEGAPLPFEAVKPPPPPRTGKEKCPECGYVKRMYSRGLCGPCFSRLRRAAPDKLPTPKPGVGRRKARNPNIKPIICTDCGEQRQPSSRDAYCAPCYVKRRKAGTLPLRVNKASSGPCEECGKFTTRVVKGCCTSCYRSRLRKEKRGNESGR
jgi:hypothetical protein